MLRRIPRLWARVLMALSLAAALSGPAIGAAAHADGAGDGPAIQPRSGQILGIVPTIGAVQNSPNLGGGNLIYHGGPVEHTNKTYAIYWTPPGFTFQPKYTSLVDRYFTDVAAASGTTRNVYFSDTQYSGILYSSTFGGSVVDTHALPAKICSDPVTPSACLTDGQIRTEINNVIAAQGWTPNSTTEFFMFTAKGIGSCFGSSCAFTSYCAYHSWMGGGTTATLYANMPYADTSPGGCDGGQHPNNNDADATLSVTSHEHNETITDEQGNAWFDNQGFENGDKCNFTFGPLKGLVAGRHWNQTINHHHYFLQEEWSNQTSRCVQRGL